VANALKKIPTVSPSASHLAVLFLGLFAGSLLTQPQLDASLLPEGNWIRIINPPPASKALSQIPAIKVGNKNCAIKGGRYIQMGAKHMLEFHKLHRRQIDSLQNLIWSRPEEVLAKCNMQKKVLYGYN
jgi:hypothetical protein